MLNQGLGKVSAEFRRGDRVHGKPQSDRWCVYDTNESQMGGEARRAQSWRVFVCGRWRDGPGLVWLIPADPGHAGLC